MDMVERITALLEKTQSGELAWKSTSERDSMALQVMGATVVLTNYEYTPRPTNPFEVTAAVALGSRQPTSGIQMSIRNTSGSTVESEFFSTDHPQYALIEELWDIAYDKIYRVTETLSALDTVLQSSPLELREAESGAEPDQEGSE